MGADFSEINWTAAQIGDDEVALWAMSARQVIARHTLPRSHPDPQPDLMAALHQIDAAPTAPVFACGLAQAPLIKVPAKPADLTPQRQQLEGRQINVLPGLHQDSPLALMQGHTAQIDGFLALNPKWDGVICLPGALTHWVQVSAAEVVSFQSTLSSGLQATLAPQLAIGKEWSESALKDAVDDTMSRPERLASRLAELRASNQLGQAQGPEIAGRLWGYLLGAELSAARPYWLGQNLALIGADQRAGPYMTALAAQGLPVTRADPARMALEGLIGVWHRQMSGPQPPDA